MDSVVTANEAKADVMADEVITEARDILDANGQVIGQLSLPQGTPEEVWQEKLAIFQYVLPRPSQNDIIKAGLKAASDFGKDLAQQGVIDSMAMGLAQAPNLLDVMLYTMTTQSFLMSGALQAALADMDKKLAAGIPENLAPFVTVDIVTARRDKIKAFLGISLD